MDKMHFIAGHSVEKIGKVSFFVMIKRNFCGFFGNLAFFGGLVLNIRFSYY